ncbi:hypothetical protein, partial [Escherichia coli]|uniref:hypothetical protein n=1 Tax=Escherichia coli TaxID=562 RepID=UPI001953B907
LSTYSWIVAAGALRAPTTTLHTGLRPFEGLVAQGGSRRTVTLSDGAAAMDSRRNEGVGPDRACPVSLGGEAARFHFLEGPDR